MTWAESGQLTPGTSMPKVLNLVVNRLAELEKRFDASMLLECLNALSDDNKRLTEENARLREQLEAATRVKQEAYDRLAALAEKVAHASLDLRAGK